MDVLYEGDGGGGGVLLGSNKIEWKVVYSDTTRLLFVIFEYTLAIIQSKG